MEKIVEELLRAGPHGGPEPYSALLGGRSRIRRVALLRCVAGFLAQEDPRRILSDAAGPYNETTAQIPRFFWGSGIENPLDGSVNGMV